MAGNELTLPLANEASITVNHSESCFVEKAKAPVFEQPYG